MSAPYWTPDALGDLEKIDKYYSSYDPDLGWRLGQAAFAASRFLSENPRAGPFVKDSPLRKWRIKRWPIILIYRERNNSVEILRLRHSSENWQAEI
jgi:plasmid stabilization system protein ParE